MDERVSINLQIKGITTDITAVISGFSKIYVETVYGGLCFVKNGCRELILIENDHTYDLKDVVQIHNPKSKGVKSYHTLTGYLIK